MKICRLIILFFSGGFLSACVAVSVPVESGQSIFFKIVNTDEKIDPSSDIIINSLIVKNWPLGIRPSDTSMIERGKNFRPDGPTTWLYILDKKNNEEFWLLETFQKKDFIKHWHVTFINNSVLISSKKKQLEAQVKLDQDFPVKLSSKSSCYAEWVKRETLKQPSKHIADDVADFKTQLILRCH